jgi:transketolase C-terminal domain/subunit
LGSLISEFVAGRNDDCEVLRCGIETMPSGQIGSQEYLLEKYGLSCDSLVKRANSMVKKRK